MVVVFSDCLVQAKDFALRVCRCRDTSLKVFMPVRMGAICRGSECVCVCVFLLLLGLGVVLNLSFVFVRFNFFVVVFGGFCCWW